MNRRSRARQHGTGARLEMTPMIDVVFLLLIFFVVTVRPQEVLATLNVSRPAAPEKTTVIPLLRIDVGKHGYVVNGRLLALETLRARLIKLQKSSPRTTLIIASTGDAPHANLVKLLDVCAGADIKNISLMSL